MYRGENPKTGRKDPEMDGMSDVSDSITEKKEGNEW
jgi:hypothetical protein